MLAYISIGLALLFLAIYLIRKPQPSPQPVKPVSDHPPQKEEPVHLGRIRIYFGSQTGAAAKLSEQLAEEGTEQGFEPEVIDLKDVKAEHFHVSIHRLRPSTKFPYFCCQTPARALLPITLSAS
jgi:sulfite reductase alpha subunit-like flavoprotein